MTAESDTDLCALFAQTVEQYPHNLAVDHPDGCLTYRKLDEASTTLAHELQGLGVGDATPIILVTAHGTLNIIAILAILKAGGFFVPIDHSTWSPDAIKHVFDTVDSQVAVNTTPEPSATPGSRFRQVLHLTHIPRVRTRLNQPGGSRPLRQPTEAEQTACTIFTSGSTGRAKGVMISHRSLALYSKMNPANMDIQPGDRLLHLLSVAFDACVCVLFSALLNGATVVPAQSDEIYDKIASCTVMAATPSILSYLPRPVADEGKEMFGKMHTILLGGETPASDLLESWIDAGVRVLTAYGATETTSMGSIHSVERDSKTGVVNPTIIGNPMAFSQVWLVNEDLVIVKDDLVEGEIIIGGEGVAQGYYKDEARTRAAFVQWNGRRVYRTGDYGRWVRARGSGGHGPVLEFRGRKDRTVKNRGFLVNLDRDVEDGLYQVGASLGVMSVRAAMTEHGIVAVVSPSRVDTTTLLVQAKKSMCAYCIPYRVEAVDDIPLSPNGKTQPRDILNIIAVADRTRKGETASETSRALTMRGNGDGEPRQDVEKKLAKVLWAAAEVLQRPGDKLTRIRAEDSFFEAGGSSLLALKLVSALRQTNLHVSVRDLLACRKFSEIARIASTTTPSPRPPGPEHNFDSTTPATAQTLADLRTQARRALRLPADEGIDAGPLTSLQLELSIPTLGDASQNVNQLRVTYAGVHAGMMERAWRAAWQNEPVFRTEICLAVGCGVQVIHKKVQGEKRPKLDVYHARLDYDAAVKAANMSVGLGCRLDFMAYRPHHAPGASRTAKERDEAELTIILTVHHSLMDGSSLRILLDRVERIAHGWSLPSSPSPVQANLRLIRMQRARDAEARALFADYLKDVVPPFERDTSVSGTTQHRGTSKTVLLKSTASIDEVTSFAAKHCVSAACVYYTAWAMAIRILERNPHVIVGGVFSSRASLAPEYEDTIGLYMSTLPLVFRFDDADEPVVARLQRTMKDLATVGEYAWARSDQVGLGRRLRNLLSMQLPLPNEHTRPPAVRVDSLENSDFPLNMLVEADGDLRVMYDEGEYDSKDIRRLGEHFKHALWSLLREKRVGDCMRIGQLQETLLEQASRVRVEIDERLTVNKALEDAMARFAELTALEDCTNTTALSYRELNSLTGVIAHYLDKDERLIPRAGAEDNTRPIAVYGDGTVGWVLGLLGIVRTGRTYVPLDPKWSVARRAAVCEQSGATGLMLVASSAQACEAPAIPGLRVLAVDDILNSSGSARPSNAATQLVLGDRSTPDSNLVVLSTSGTTGTPKGVPISNRGFLAMQSNPEATMFAAPGRRIAQFMSPAFDCCNLEIFSALLHGATLVLRDPEDPLANLARVNTAMITPSVSAILDLDRFPNLETVYAAGEPLTSPLVNRFATRTLFYNAYGPAECSILTSCTRMIPGDTVTVGTALATARMYVLDDEQQPSPVGTRGEIYVAGIQVLRGFANPSEQGVGRILPDPWHHGERMYRSGDYGMLGRDGRVVCMGRVDRQLKIRGQRVELSGVEQAILFGRADDEGIVQCAAIAIHDTLVAFIRFDDSNGNGSEEERISRLRNRLAETLFPAWIPQVILPLAEFPRTVNGKADTRALAAVYASKAASHRSSVSLMAPTANSTSTSTSSQIRDELAAEWRRILELDDDAQIQDSDDFISLGGHSVLFMLLATRLSATFDVDIPLRQLLPTPLFQGQVDLIRDMLVHSKGDEGSQRQTEHEHDTLSTEDLTELERQVWFQYQVATNRAAFNIAALLTLKGAVDLGRLVDSLNEALASDPVLRSNLVEGPRGPERKPRESAPKVRRVTRSRLNMDEEVNRPFDLENHELIRVYLLAPESGNPAAGGSWPVQLLIVTSHTIADLGTLQNLLQTTSKTYATTSCIHTPPKHQRPLHLDSARWTTAPSPETQAFWQEYLAGHSCEPIIPLPPSTLGTFQGASRMYEFRGPLVTSLTGLLRRLGVTHHHLALTAAALTLQWLSCGLGEGHEQNDIVLGAPNAGRSTSAESQALGQFLDRLPVRVRLDDDDDDGNPDIITTATTTTLLARVRNSARAALAHAMPFAAVLAALGYPSGSLRHPLFECMVTFHRRGAGLDRWLQLQLPEGEGEGGPGIVTASAQPLFARGVAKFPLMLEWYELDGDDDDGDGTRGDRWMLHVELHDMGTGERHLQETVDVLRDVLEVVLRAVADECSLTELRARLDGLRLPPLPVPVVMNGAAVNGAASSTSSNSDSTDSSSAVVDLATKIRDEMVVCLGEMDVKHGTDTKIRDGNIQMALDMSFFEAGANSTAAIVLRHRLREKLDVQMSARDVFSAQSPLNLAQLISS